MKSSVCVSGRNWNVSFTIVLSIVTVAPLWLTPAMGTFVNAQTTSSPADWTEFHRDNMQRWNPYETVLSVSNVGGLQVKWKNPIGLYNNVLTSSPAVVNGVVYFGSDDNNVYALNASTGAKIWSSPTGKSVQSSPAVANGVVYVNSDNLYAFNASTGVFAAAFGTGGSVSSPVVVNGIVYFGSGIGDVWAVDASTLGGLWHYSTGGPVISSPAVANGIVYVGSNDHKVYALDASTGAKLWSYTTGNAVSSSPAVVNGVVYVGSEDGDLYALNASTGVQLWSFPTGNAIVSSPAVANGVVYIANAFVIAPIPGNVYALNASTGAELWSAQVGEGGEIESAPAVANGVVYIASSDGRTGLGTLSALNASTGAKLWSYAAGYNTSSPAIVDGVVYVRSGDKSGGNMYAFGLGSADLFLRIIPSLTTVHQGDLLTYAFPVWNLGPGVAEGEVLSNLQVPAGTTFDYIRISGTPGLGTCTHPPYGGTGQIICHEGDGMAPNTTWTVRLTVKVTAPSGTVITESAATMANTPDPNLANNTATVSTTVQ